MTGKKKLSSTRQRSKRFRELKKARDAVESLRPIGPRLDRHERPVEPPAAAADQQGTEGASNGAIPGLTSQALKQLYERAE